VLTDARRGGLDATRRDQPTRGAQRDRRPAYHDLATTPEGFGVPPGGLATPPVLWLMERFGLEPTASGPAAARRAGYPRSAAARGRAGYRFPTEPLDLTRQIRRGTLCMAASSPRGSRPRASISPRPTRSRTRCSCCARTAPAAASPN
jgi:hypothetical protein